MNKQALAAKIWESANRMRSKIEANEYKDYILGFIFYKFLSDNEVRYLKDTDWTDEYLPELTEEDDETVKSVQQNIGYFISYDNLFSTWIQKGADFSAGDVTDALSAFDRLINPAHEKVFSGIFTTLQTGLSKLGETSDAKTKAIRGLIDLIKDIPMNGKQDYDVLGFIYEYLLSNFAANAGKKAGEFYTPHEVSLLMSEIVANHLQNRKQIEIYDPTSGSGSLLINIGRCAAKYIGGENRIKYYAQEYKENTYNLTRMNLVMRGILPDNIVTRNGDTLEDDWPYFEEHDRENTYERLYVDAVVSNPPYSQVWDPTDKESDPRFARFGVAPKSKADYAFLLHDLYHLKSDGIIAIVLPHGVLFRGGEEGTIRKNLIEQNHIDTIIGLPANIFFGTGIPTIIMILKQKRDNTDVLIIDASKGFAKEGKNNTLRACDIKKIVDVVVARQTVDRFSKVVSRDEIRDNDYNLNIPRYVDTAEKAESWDIYASMFGGIPEKELHEYQAYWQAFPTLKDALFATENGVYYSQAVPDLQQAVFQNADVMAYQKHYRQQLDAYETFLTSELLGKMGTLPIAQEEDILSTALFQQLQGTPIIDQYSAYQYLHDDWNQIANDLEIIQTEGVGALKKVDPHYVLKKQRGKDVEIQDGWIGHILPFTLVQEAILPHAVQALQEKNNCLNEISSEIEALFDELDEDAKEKNFVNQEKTAFVFSEVDKALKAKAVVPETLDILKQVKILNSEEKSLKRDIKDEEQQLHALTKETIESLSDDEAMQLIKQKWIDSLIQDLQQMQTELLHNFVKQMESLCQKYEITFSALEDQIRDTENELKGMLDDLTGNEFDMKGIAELKKLLGGE